MDDEDRTRLQAVHQRVADIMDCGSLHGPLLEAVGLTKERFVDAKTVYLVVMDRGGLFGAYLERESADRAARAIEAVVVAAPIVADYRP